MALPDRDGGPGRAAAYAALLDHIERGITLHYGPGGSGDADLDLLEGDRAYADGLFTLAELGDLAATRILGDAISEVARAHADGRPEIAELQWEQARSRIRGNPGPADTPLPPDSQYA